MTNIAALYVESGGCYFGLPHVDPWDQQRTDMAEWRADNS